MTCATCRLRESENVVGRVSHDAAVVERQRTEIVVNAAAIDSYVVGDRAVRESRRAGIKELSVSVNCPNSL
jgi:hypothetical protein